MKKKNPEPEEPSSWDPLMVTLAVVTVVLIVAVLAFLYVIIVQPHQARFPGH